jgi:thiamine-phosphate diphosphorylase
VRGAAPHFPPRCSIVPRFTICLVTGDHGNEPALLELIASAVDGGVDLIQLRERRLDDRALCRVTSRAVELAGHAGSHVIVNDRADVALAAGAAGVHLRSDSFAATRLRAAAPPGFLIGRSVHTREEAIAAARDGCDYVVFGTVFPSSSKPLNHETAGLDALREVVGSVRLPVLAIGGISLDNAAEVAKTGASGIAAISLFEDRTTIPITVAELRRLFDT